MFVVVYFAIYTWIAIPPPALFLGWEEDTVLTVIEVVEAEYSQYVKPGDIVLGINGRLLLRGEPIFYPPIKHSYTFTLQRGEKLISQEVVIASHNPITQVWKLSSIILSLAFWVIGLATVLFAHPRQIEALWVGFGFQLIGAGIISPGVSQLGAPGGWVIGHVLIFFFPLIVLYLGFLPRYTTLRQPTKTFLQYSFYALSVFSVLAAIEVVFLFPHTSYQTLIGVSTGDVLSVLTGCSILVSITVLCVRLIKTAKQSYERQQLAILLFFFALAVMPILFFVILPVNEYIFVPYPFVFSLLLLAPAGYFFVMHRHGYLALDAVFGRIITIVVLFLAIGMAYATGSYLLEQLLGVEINGAGRFSFVFVLLGIAVVSQKQVQTFVDLLLYGREPLGHDAIQAAQAKLSAHPEQATVTDVVMQVATRLNVQQTAVMFREEDKHILLAGNVPSFTLSNSELCRKVCIRSQAPDSFSDFPAWVEISLPIVARSDMLGLFLLSRPVNGYFNARQTQLLQGIADILAFSLLVINLVESMQLLSQRSMYEKELQRQQLATEIHNQPLHTLTLVTMHLGKYATDASLKEAAHSLRQVSKDLRRIISGLRPPALKASVEWMTQQVVREFDETHDNITVTLGLHITSEKRVPEQTKYAFYYILTEALNNVSKHAQATTVHVDFVYEHDTLTLEVKDDGIGGDVVTLPLAELLRRQHTGISDMHRWASIGKGRLEITANEPSGTVIKLLLPV
ncbi:MAG: hypothetical protein GY943_02040 [Chloroflexi bacterium]|nr:hypothetical protein [Chloroflexota bacterium]